MIRDIYLAGPLADRFGAGPYRLKADNIRELISGLTMHHPSFRRELLRHHDLAILKKKGSKVAYVDSAELDFQFGDWPELHLAAGEFGSAEGAAAVAAYFAQAGTAAYYAIYAVSYVAITAAVSYGVSVIAQSLADTIDTSDAKRAENKSFLFNGPDNRETQGGRVQLLYGRFRCGSYTLSQSLEARRQAVGISDSLTTEEGTPISVNIFRNDYALVSPTVVSFTVNGTTTSAGGTLTTPTYTLTIASNGDLTFSPAIGSGGTYFTVDVSSTSEGTPFSSTVSLGSTVNYSQFYDYPPVGVVGGNNSEGDGGNPGGA